MGGGNHKLLLADLTVKDDLKRLIHKVEKIDGVVLSTGKGLTLPVQFSTYEKFIDLFNTNFFSPIELLRLLFKNRVLNNGSSVVIIDSVGGTRVFNAASSIYGSSKAALNSMMKYCAYEFSKRKIRVNSICPGMVNTPFIHRDTVSDEQLQQDENKYPLKRYGKPEDIAYACIYLLSEASSWMTGQELVLDGGVTLT